jgi:acyl-CoA thioesterase-2
MRPVLSELVDLLSLERIEVNLFRGKSQDLGWGQVFGGQVLGQALSAAHQTVPPDRQVHSLHSYFLRVGDCRTPIVYTVDPIRDGRSFTTRRVVAVQHGKPIFHLSASFQVDEPGFDHQDVAPDDLFDPETLRSERELAKGLKGKLPDALYERAIAERPIDIRPERPHDPTRPSVREPTRRVWFRAADLIDGPSDSTWLHSCLLAYASDFGFLTTAMQPHGASWLTPGMQVASLDHAMWFHRPLRVDEWLLYDVESPSASGARGLVRGRVFDQQGRLVATVVQEGLMRDRRPRDGR